MSLFATPIADFWLSGGDWAELPGYVRLSPKLKQKVVPLVAGRPLSYAAFPQYAKKPQPASDLCFGHSSLLDEHHFHDRVEAFVTLKCIRAHAIIIHSAREA